MRLTLRTVLAYLDDQLEPAEAREIGAKLSESREATALVNRIREVIRRRRIGAPELAGPGSGPDPNVVADYLENALAPNLVVELERLCQNSDVHLAEVAACHKILTMILGQPVAVDDDFRSRMHALGATRAAPQAAATPLPPMAEGIGDSRTTSAMSGLPDGLTRRTGLQRYSVIGAIGLTAIVWVALVVTDESLWTRRAPVDRRVAAAEVGQVTDELVVQEEFVTPQLADAAPVAVPQAPVANVEQMPNAGDLASAGENVIAPESVVPPPPDARPPMAPVTAAEGKTPADEDAAVEDARDVIGDVLNPTLPEKSLTYLVGDRLVIRRLTDQTEWRIFDVQDEARVGDDLASPEPFRNSYELEGLLELTMEPGSRIRRLPRAEEADLAFELDRGRLILRRIVDAAEPVDVDITTPMGVWRVSLTEPQSKLGIELIRQRPTGPPDSGRMAPMEGGLAAADGHVQVKLNDGSAVELSPANGFCIWPTLGGELVTQGNFPVPNWMQSPPPELLPTARNLLRQYRDEFVNQFSVVDSIAPVARDRRALMAELGVKTLALIDRYQQLLPALNSEHQEARLAAIEGLRVWLGKPGDHVEPLQEELGRNFRAPTTDVVARLLWGFEPTDLRDRDLSGNFITWLQDDSIAVRELAFYWLSKLTGRTQDYLPMAPANERRAAVTRWESWRNEHNGALVP